MHTFARVFSLAAGVFLSAQASAAPPVGYGPSFRVQGAFLFPEEEPQWMAELGGKLLYFGDHRDASGSRRGLHVTDGSATTFLADLIPSRDPRRRSIFARLGDVLLFPARRIPPQVHDALDDVDDIELWRTDGTPEGTWRVLDLVPGPTGSYPRDLAPHRGAIYFATDSGIYRTDGTAEGTFGVLQRPLRLPSRLGSTWLTSLGDTLYFVASDEASGFNLWKLWPCPGTSSLHCQSQVAGGEYPTNLTAFGGRLLFGAYSLATEPDGGLFVTDDGAPGASLVAQIRVADMGPPSRFTKVVGDRAFVVGVGAGSLGEALWVTDGSPGGTLRLLDGFVAYTDELVAMGGRLYFRAGTPVLDSSGRWWYEDEELWRSDGTREGTSRVVDICPGTCGSAGYRWIPPLAVEPEGYLFWSARDPESGHALWRTDGTEEGTLLVEDRRTDGFGGAVSMLRAGDLVYFGVFSDENPYMMELRAVPIDLSDRDPPEVSCPAADLAAEAASPAGASVTFPPLTVRDNLSPSCALSAVPASGSTFPIGLTRVLVTAVDDAGNAGECGFDVRVVDTTAPTLTCPPDVVAEASSAAGASVRPPEATATDAASEVAVATDPPGGSLFALGRTLVTVAGTDAAGNVGTCGFWVIVVDTTPPALTCPADLTVEATSAAGGAASWSPPAAVDAVSPSLVATTHGSGATFPLGETRVTVVAVDGDLNASTCGFSVRVVDSIPPAVTCPGDVSVVAPTDAGAPATWAAPVATDAVTALPLVTLDHASGQAFPPGSTVVRATATDEAGLTSECTFLVTVTVAAPPPAGPPQEPPPEPPPAPRQPQDGGCGTGGLGALSLAGLAALFRRRRARTLAA